MEEKKPDQTKYFDEAIDKFGEILLQAQKDFRDKKDHDELSSTEFLFYIMGHAYNVAIGHALKESVAKMRKELVEEIDMNAKYIDEWIEREINPLEEGLKIK